MARYSRKPKNFKEFDNKELFVEFQKDRDQKMRDELVHRHMYIADILSKKYYGKGIDSEDIFQVASLGLLYSVDRFDPERGFEFSSFATPTIVGEIKKYFRDKGWAIRVPRRIQELTKKVSNARSDLQVQLQRHPTVKDIAYKLQITEDAVIEAIEASYVYAPRSLDQQFEGEKTDQEVQLRDIIGEEDKEFTIIENRDFIANCMSKLSEPEAQIIKKRYFQEKTQIQVAKDMGVSQMTISRTEKKIIKKFRAEIARYHKI